MPSIKARLAQLHRMHSDLSAVLTKACKDATLQAVEVTAKNTPPKDGTGRGEHSGAHTLTGRLKASWRTDSETEPVHEGNTYKTVLVSNMQYASYVERGHRLDRHFVPGLYVDDFGQLAYAPSGTTPNGESAGLTVGTKTRYVHGEWMADKGSKEYERALGVILDEEIQKWWKGGET